jgi:hypothetical protein
VLVATHRCANVPALTPDVTVVAAVHNTVFRTRRGALKNLSARKHDNLWNVSHGHMTSSVLRKERMQPLRTSSAVPRSQKLIDERSMILLNKSGFSMVVLKIIIENTFMLQSRVQVKTCTQE